MMLRISMMLCPSLVVVKSEFSVFVNSTFYMFSQQYIVAYFRC